MEDNDLLAAIGEVVVSAAFLEYAMAVLVAFFNGLRDQDCEDRAMAIVKTTGLARRELRKLASAHPERHDLRRVAADAVAVLDDRHVIAHSVALDEVEAGGQAALVIHHPKSGRETQITTADLRSHAQDIRITLRRITAIIAAEGMARP